MLPKLCDPRRSQVAPESVSKNPLDARLYALTPNIVMQFRQAVSERR